MQYIYYQVKFAVSQILVIHLYLQVIALAKFCLMTNKCSDNVIGQCRSQTNIIVMYTNNTDIGISDCA